MGLSGVAQFQQLEFTLRAFLPLSFSPEYFEQNDLTDEPDPYPGASAAHRGPSFTSCRRMHVEDRFSCLVGKERSDSQDFLDALQGMHYRYDCITPTGLRPDHKATAILCSPNIENHGTG